MAPPPNRVSSSSVRTTWRLSQRQRQQQQSDQGAASSSGNGRSHPQVGRAPAWMIGASVPRKQWDDPEVEGFMRRCEPVVLTGCPLVGGLVGKWSFDYLAQHFGDYDKLAVHFAPRDTSAFSRHYGEGLGKGGCAAMSFARFVALCKAEHLAPDGAREGRAPLRYYLQAPVVWNDGDRSGVHGHSLESGNRPLAKAPFGPIIEADVRKDVDWEWLQRARDLTNSHPFDTCQMWAGHGGGSTPLHFDAVSNFLAQVAGRKQILLYSPAQTWGVYPYPVGHPMDNFAMIDVEQPDLERFPALARTKALEAILTPGDVLWLPRFYWHYVYQLDAPSENLSLNFWVGRKGTEGFMQRMRNAPLPADAEVDAEAARAAATFAQLSSSKEAADAALRADEQLLLENAELAMDCLHAGRIIEGAARSVLQGNKERGDQFLGAIAVGADASWPPDSMARVQARRIRKELMAVLGGTAASALFRLATRDGRLFPGLARPLGERLVLTEKGQYTEQAELDAWFAGVPMAAGLRAVDWRSEQEAKG